MINLPLIRTLICSALLMAEVSRPAFAADDVIGLWSSATRTKGGIGTQLNVSSDGSFMQTLGAIVDFRYEIYEGKVSMTFSAGDDVMTQPFVLRDNVLIFNAGMPSEQVMRRTKESPHSDNLVGEWNYEHYTGGPALLRYSSRDVGQLVVPIVASRGRYEVAGSQINVKLEGQRMLRYDFQVNQDTLTLRDEGGKETKFRRFRY